MYKILLFVSILFAACGQILLKKSTQNGIKFVKGQILKTLIKMYLNKYFIAGAVGYALGTIFFLIVLSHLDLSFIYPIVSMNFVFVTLLSITIFKEKVSKKRWLSMLIITTGVIITTLS